MTYEMYQTIFWHAGVLTIIFAVGDVLLFVILKIPKVDRAAEWKDSSERNCRYLEKEYSDQRQML